MNCSHFLPLPHSPIAMALPDSLHQLIGCCRTGKPNPCSSTNRLRQTQALRRHRYPRRQEWIDHNECDPDITLLQLIGSLTEIMLYRVSSILAATPAMQRRELHRCNRLHAIVAI
ncbi:MAG: hypothetical protein QG615_27, partial [Nitrospirota bacterium]|nr:hypothetical protein [Nitrospirota bacterium]